MNWPISGRMRAAKTISLLWVGSIMGAGCAFLTQVVLARQFGPTDFGAFAAVLGTVTLVTPLASFGLGSFWLRAFGNEGWRGVRWLRSSLRYSMLTTVLAISVLCTWAEFGPHDATVRGILFVLSAYLLGQVAVELVSAKLQLEERYFGLALWQMLPQFLRLSSVLILAFAIENFMSLCGIAIAYAFVSVVIFGYGTILLLRMYKGRFDLKGHGADPVEICTISKTTGILQLAGQSWPFGLAGLFYLIYFQSDIILLKYIKGDEAAGIYNIAFVIMGAVYILPSVIYQKFLMPKLHRWAEHDESTFRRVYRFGNRLMLLLGVIAMVTIWLLTPWGVPYLFGDSYIAAVFPLSILALAAPARFIASSAGAVLATRHHMINKIYIMGMAAVINVVLNLIFIPVYGIYGAVVATVATEFLLMFTMQIYAKKYVFKLYNKG